MQELMVRVARRQHEAEGICSFELVADPGQALPPFTAGAHLDVCVAPGLVRQYSLCNDPSQTDRYRIAVLREPASRGGSVGMHDKVQVGDRLKVSAPRNHFPLLEAPHSLLLAGGIGVTPILAMARHLHATGAAFEMHYCGRSTQRMAFIDELAQSPFASMVQVHADDGAPEQRLDASRVLASVPDGSHLYVCGPGGFMDHVLGTARAMGWPEARLHREYFAGVVSPTDVDSAFDVRVASTGQTLHVPAHQRVIDVLAAHGINVPVSCESGVCGTCLTRVLDGRVDHRDTFLTDSERQANDQFTPCCSRASSALLVLDL